eukprot:c13727_g1_i2 orf=194-409(-)
MSSILAFLSQNISMTYTPQQNGIAEIPVEKARNIVDVASADMASSSVRYGIKADGIARCSLCALLFLELVY